MITGQYDKLMKKVDGLIDFVGQQIEKRPFVISGICLLLAWPIAALWTAFLYNSPNVPHFFATMRSLLAFTLLMIPVVWLAAFVLWLLEVRGRKRGELLGIYARAPYVAAGAHFCLWIVQGIAV